MVKGLVFTRNMRGADVLLASVVTTRLSRLESGQGRQIKKSRMLLLNVCFVFPSCQLPQVANRHVGVSARDY